MEKQAGSNLRNWLRQVDYVLLDAARSPEIAPAIMQQADAWLPLWNVGEEGEGLALEGLDTPLPQGRQKKG